MIPSDIPIPLPGGLETPLPRFHRAEQRFNADEVADVDRAMADQFAKFADIDLSGKSVAVAVGSRGIRSQPPVVFALVRLLKEAGAKPFLVPAMGSHGAGSAQGQRKILEDYGFTEEALGIPIKSSMEVVQLDTVDDGLRVFCDKIAFEADYMVAVNRVKPHTSFRGRHESGLCKMLAIGVGKHAGAVEMHRRGMDRFGELLPVVTRAFLAHTRLLCGVAIVENGYEKLAHVEMVPPDEIIERDAALLERAKTLIPRILLDKLDVLVVDEIGKNISGGGMDPNVTGRNAGRHRDFGGPEIERIVIRDLTEGTHGNATGMGTADITTQRLLRKLDWTKTYVNLVTAGVPGPASLPMVANNDREAMYIAMRSIPMITPESARIMRIENTLDLGEVWVSTALAAEVEAHPDMRLLSDAFDIPFDAEGWIPSMHAKMAAAE